MEKAEAQSDTASVAETTTFQSPSEATEDEEAPGAPDTAVYECQAGEVAKIEEKVTEEEDASSDGGFGFCLVREKILNDLRVQVKAGKDITREAVDKLMDFDDVGPEEMIVPVDLAALGGDFEDLETLFEKFGPKGVAEAFLKAQDNFEENKKNLPEGTAPAPMTAWEWLAMERRRRRS